VAVAVDAAAAEEAVLHHVLAEQKKSNYQCGQQQEAPNVKSRGSWSLWSSVIQMR
jgi:hypothetical protein